MTTEREAQDQPAAPTLQSKTETTIRVTAVAGQEYSIDEGKTWQTSGSFTGLTAGTTYRIITRKVRTETQNASEESEALSVTTDKQETAQTSVAATQTADTKTTTAQTADTKTTTTDSTASDTGATSKSTATAAVAVGDTKTVKSGGVTVKYEITGTGSKAASRTVEYVSATSAKTAITVPATIKISGKAYRVTSVATNAFSKCKKAKTIKLGSYVSQIGRKAFGGCSALQKLTVGTKKLTAKGIDSKAFSGVKETVTVKVPSGYVKKYTKLFQKKNLSKKVTIK